MKKVNYLLGLVLLALLCADGFVVGQGMTFYPAITSDEQSALLTGAVQTNDTRNVALGGNLSVSGEITGSGNAPKLRFNGTNTTVLSGTVIGEVSFENSDISNNTFPFAGTTASIRAIATRDFASTGGADTDLIFLTNDQNAPTAGTNLTLIERMRITSAGNVFISNNLTVNGAITSTNAVDAPIKAVTGSSQTKLTFWTGSAASYAALAIRGKCDAGLTAAGGYATA